MSGTVHIMRNCFAFKLKRFFFPSSSICRSLFRFLSLCFEKKNGFNRFKSKQNILALQFWSRSFLKVCFLTRLSHGNNLYRIQIHFATDLHRKLRWFSAKVHLVTIFSLSVEWWMKQCLLPRTIIIWANKPYHVFRTIQSFSFDANIFQFVMEIMWEFKKSCRK